MIRLGVWETVLGTEWRGDGGSHLRITGPLDNRPDSLPGRGAVTVPSSCIFPLLSKATSSLSRVRLRYLPREHEKSISLLVTLDLIIRLSGQWEVSRQNSSRGFTCASEFGIFLSASAVPRKENTSSIATGPRRRRKHAEKTPA